MPRVAQGPKGIATANLEDEYIVKFARHYRDSNDGARSAAKAAGITDAARATEYNAQERGIANFIVKKATKRIANRKAGKLAKSEDVFASRLDADMLAEIAEAENEQEEAA